MLRPLHLALGAGGLLLLVLLAVPLLPDGPETAEVAAEQTKARAVNACAGVGSGADLDACLAAARAAEVACDQLAGLDPERCKEEVEELTRAAREAQRLATGECDAMETDAARSACRSVVRARSAAEPTATPRQVEIPGAPTGAAPGPEAGTEPTATPRQVETPSTPAGAAPPGASGGAPAIPTVSVPLAAAIAACTGDSSNEASEDACERAAKAAEEACELLAKPAREACEQQAESLEDAFKRKDARNRDRGRD